MFCVCAMQTKPKESWLRLDPYVRTLTKKNSGEKGQTGNQKTCPIFFLARSTRNTLLFNRMLNLENKLTVVMVLFLKTICNKITS